MFFNVDNFLRPLSEGDRNIKIYDQSDLLIYSVSPFSILNILVNNNLLKINLKSNRIITLDFGNASLSKNALVKLQLQIDQLTGQVPFLIDKQVKNYIENQLFSNNVSIESGFGEINYIPRWVSGQTLSSVGSIYDDGDKIYVGTTSGNYLVNINGTLSTGDILPLNDYTTKGYNIGSPQLRWENIYVKDALLASQSLYLGDSKLSVNENGIILLNDRAINKYEGTSSTPLTVPGVGTIVELNTQTNLSYLSGDSIKVANRLKDNFSSPGYSQEGIYGYFIGLVDAYDINTGVIRIILQSTPNQGFESDIWYLKYSSDIFDNSIVDGTFSATSIVSGDILPKSDYTIEGYNIGSPQLRWENIYVRARLVASQSVYIGQNKLSVNDDGVILFGERAINKYEGTSPTTLTIPEVGAIVTLFTQQDLSYIQGDSIKVANRLKDNYSPDGYSEESIYGYFLGLVDSYYKESGEIKILLTYTEHLGFESSVWYLKYNSDTIGFENTLNIQLDQIYEQFKGLKLVGTSSTEISIPNIGDVREMYTDLDLGFYAGQQVIVFNEIINNYEDEDYVEGNGQYFIGRVDYYYPQTGFITIVTDFSSGSGTFSDWQITVSSNPIIGSQLGETASFTELNVTGPLSIQQVIENLITATSIIAASPSSFNLDFNNGSIYYIEPEGENFLANYINVPTTDDKIISTTIIISQSSTAYIPITVSINEEIVPISWANGSLPSGNANQTDIVGFTLMRKGGSWVQVFGQLSTFITI